MTARRPEGVFRRRRPGRQGEDPRRDFFPGWYARWTDESGKRVTRFAGETLSDARAFVDEQRADSRTRRRRDPHSAAERGEELFSRFAKVYLRDLVDGRRLRSAKERHTHVDAWVDHFGPGASLADVSEDLVLELLATLADKGRSVATRNRYLATLRHLVNTAVRRRKLEASPLQGIQIEREENERTRTLTLEEEVKLIRAARAGGSAYLPALIILALETGARRGELLGLRWADVDLGRRVITFRKTKAKRTRQVPMSARARETLLTISSRGEGEPSVFTYQGEPLQTPRKAFASACKAAGLHYGTAPHPRTGEEGVVFHTLRHSFISRRAEQGVPASVIQELSGHRTLAMVERYTHISDAALRAVVQGMDEEWRLHGGHIDGDRGEGGRP